MAATSVELEWKIEKIERKIAEKGVRCSRCGKWSRRGIVVIDDRNEVMRRNGGVPGVIVVCSSCFRRWG